MNVTDLLALDRLSADCLAARDMVRADVERIREGIRRWEPRPRPKNGRPAVTATTRSGRPRLILRD